MRDHGGNLDAAIARFGGTRAHWIDLSTGINPRPYPLPEIRPAAWSALPTNAEIEMLARAAQGAYGCTFLPLPLAGAQAAIQLVPHLARPGRARVLSPTYNEHAAALQAAGWQVTAASDVAALAGSDIAVVVNPNNPDGRRTDPATLRAIAAKVGLLVVDESFADPHPEVSLADTAGSNIIALKSFGKFYGLAGLRLGFALGGEQHHAALKALAGPWQVSGPAVAVGCAALADEAWRTATVARLSRDAARLDTLARSAGWDLVGGTSLFRLYDTGGALAVQERLAQAHIWSRVFPYSESWLRLGLPDGGVAWDRVTDALG